MTSKRVLIESVIRRGAAIAGSSSAAMHELLYNLKKGVVKASGDHWGYRSEIRIWERNTGSEPLVPLPIPPHAWETADVGRLLENKITWSDGWLGQSPPWGNVEINFVHEIHVSVDEIGSVWPNIIDLDGPPPRHGGHPMKGVGGVQADYDWEKYLIEAAVFMHISGVPKSQAALFEHLWQIFGGKAGGPSLTQMKTHIGPLYRRYKASDRD